jgi:outer membrane protein OmpA-like peptidoglycan-associated protein
MSSLFVRSYFPRISIAVACSLLASGCAIDRKTSQPSLKETFASDDPCSNNSRNIGIAVGTVLGAVVGHQIDHRTGRFVGAAAGALAGGFIGADMDRRRCELAKVAKQYDLDMSFAMVNSEGIVVDDTTLNANRNANELKKTAIGNVVSLQDQTADGGHFAAGSDKLTPRAQQYFSAIAHSYSSRKAAEGIVDEQARKEYMRQIAERRLLLVGHTDDTGSSKYNAELSERRARTVAKYLSEQGIPLDSLYFQGAGESYPTADNTTEEGRARNRRVEFIELAGDANLRKFLDARKPKYEYYRPVDIASATNAAVSSASPAPVKEKSSMRTGAPSNRKNKENAAANDVRVTVPSTSVASASTASTSVPVASSSSLTSPRSPQIVSSRSPTGTLPKTTSQYAFIDFGGVPISQTVAVTDVGKVDAKRPWFALVSPAYANEPAVLHDCTQDRPRNAGAVKSLRDNKEYDTSEHLPGLYGKTWTDKVNGHQVVINKISVLRNDAAVARLPEFKVYKNYNPAVSRNPAADLTITPAVNTYLGSHGVLYRMFLNGSSGVQCADILFGSEGASLAKAGKLFYLHDNKPYVVDFRPSKI